MLTSMRFSKAITDAVASAKGLASNLPLEPSERVRASAKLHLRGTLLRLRAELHEAGGPVTWQVVRLKHGAGYRLESAEHVFHVTLTLVGLERLSVEALARIPTGLAVGTDPHSWNLVAGVVQTWLRELAIMGVLTTPNLTAQPSG